MQWTVPEEGALVEVDTFAIPKVAKNPEGAHQFIDFLYRPENQLKLMTDMGYDTVSAAAHEQLPEDLAEGFKAPEGDERVGDVSNVLFSNGWIRDDDGTVFIYYASSDTRMHVATTTVERLLAEFSGVVAAIVVCYQFFG